jgi:CheY-like chemotaxis protein
MEPSEPPLSVLLVEADQMVAEMYRVKLELDGYLVTVVSDRTSALRTALTEPPDLIFLDVGLSDTDGLSVLEALKRDERTRHLPVVLLTNRADPGWASRADELRALLSRVRSETPSALPDWLVWQQPVWRRPA